MSRALRPSPSCLNCGVAVATRFCAECGQENTDYRVSLGRLLGDLFEELFQLESRLWRTLWTLVRRPGLLTREYNAGRRVRYTTPLRLYLLCSVTYFFVGSVTPAGQSVSDNVKFELGDEVSLEHARNEVHSQLVQRALDRLREVQHDPQAASQRARQALREYAPRLAAVLVPLFALLTLLLFRRPRLFYVEHLVLALHTHATFFLFLTPSLLGRQVQGGLATIGFAVASVATFMALRAVFGQSRLRTSWKFVVLGSIYGIFLSVGVAAVALIGVLMR
jgi:hypothetical protein